MSIERFARLRETVEALCAPRERLVGHPGHHEALRWLIEAVQRCGLSPYHGRFQWPYQIDGTHFVNLLARLPGRSPEREPMLVAAHYDTCGHQPGADDNAAAIAILLDTVEPLRRAKLERDVIFAFFDAEEPPYFLTHAMGSTHFYGHQRRETIHFAMVLDLCGHDVPIPGREELLFVVGAESASNLPELVMANDGKHSLRTVAVLNRTIGDLSDHHAFRVDGRPYLFLTCARWEHYHAETDTPDRLNYQKMSNIGDYVVETLGQCDTADLSGRGHDTTQLEAALMRKHLQPLTEVFGIEPHTRRDVDMLVRAAMASFGV